MEARLASLPTDGVPQREAKTREEGLCAWVKGLF